MLKIVKFIDVCMTGGIMHTPSHTNVWYSLLILAYSNVYEFSAAILEKGLFFWILIRRC